TGDCDLFSTIGAQTTIVGGQFTTSPTGSGALDGIVDEFAIYTSALSAATVTTHYAATSGFTQVQFAGQRINAILDILGWPAADRLIDSGQFQMQPILAA